MDATQRISDSILESDGEESEGESENRKGSPLAKLCILKNEHIPETELPLFLGDNVLGRDPSACSLPLSSPSISKQHATISISVYARRGRHSVMDIEALIWDVGSMNGTRKGRLRLTPNVRYALSDGDSLVVADIPCQYVSCAVKQKDLGTPVSKIPRVKDRLAEGSEEKGNDGISGSKKCVNKEAKARESLTKTPVSAGCLSIEQTPTQPQGMLVPDSDSESEDEKWGKRTRGLKTVVSDSDSQKSSPTCSTFLSPVNKIVPESEDESPVTPLSSTKKIPYKDDSLGNDESGVVLGLKQIMQNDAATSAEDGEGEKATVTPEAIKPDKNDQHVSTTSETNVHLAVNDDLLVRSPEVSTNLITAFNMDSDTDMEGEEEGLASAGHVMLNINQVDRPPNTDQFHLDSDTDVDEDVDDFNKAPKTVPLSENLIKSFHVKSHIQSEESAVDSDTDVDEDPAVSDAAKKSESMPLKKSCVADAAPSVQQNDFCLHSDSDVDEEAETKCTKNESSSKIDARLDVNPVSPNSTNATPHSLHLDSDTDDEAKPIPALSEAPVVSPSTKVCPTADTGANLAILPDSDTDVEADSPLVVPVAVTTLSVSSTNMSDALQSVSDADTDVDEPMVSSAGNVHNSSDHRVNSGTDVENKEVDECQSPKLCKEQTLGFLNPAAQTCSTPVQVSGVAAPAVGFYSCSDSQDEEDFVVAETQSFVLQTRHSQGNPSDDHILDPINAGIEPSNEEKDEPSSNRRSFHLGLSDSSHLQCQTHALATESTQAFFPLDKHLNLEETQAYASISTTGTAAENNADYMEATQAYGREEEKEAKVDFALEATQAYISELHSDSENDTDQNSSEETQPLDCPTSSTLAMAETQPMSGYAEEESLAENSSLMENVRSKTLKEAKDEHVEVAQPQGQFLGEALSVAETQPMRTCDDEYTEIVANSKSDIDTQPVDTAEESSQEDSIPFVRKKRTKALQLEETQPLSSTGMLTVEPQPVVALEDSGSDDENLIPGPKKRKGKPLEEECMQTLSNSDLSSVETKAVNMNVAETQPMATSGNEQSDVESDEENSPTLVNTKLPAVDIQQKNTIEKVESDEELLCSRKRRTKALQLEETQPLSSPEMLTVETQPVVALEDKESDDEDLIPGPRKRKAKPLQLEEESQTLTNSELSVAETQSMATSGNGENNVESEEEKSPILVSIELSALEIQQRDATEKVAINEKDEIFNSRKRRTKQQQLKQMQPLSSSGGSILDTQPMGSCKDEESIREDLISASAKPFQLDDKQTESLTTTEVCGVDPQLRVTAEDEESGNKESFPGPGKIQAKVLQLKLEDPQMHSDFKGSTAENQYLETKSEHPRTVEHSEPGTSGVAVRILSGTGQQLKEEDQQAKCSGPSKRQTKGKTVKKQNERKKREEKKILGNEKIDLEESLQGEKTEQVNLLGLEREEAELEKGKKAQEKQSEEQQENIKDANMLKVPTRGRRAARRTATQLEQDSTASTNDDVPAKRTRSRSNSSNSVSSERSVSSINTQESRGRGRGREVKRTGDTPMAATARGSNRRRTVAAETTQQISNDISPRECRSRSNSSNSLNSEISSCSEYTQIKGRGGRQRGRGRKTEPNLIPPISSQGVQNISPKPAARGRKSSAAAGSTNREKVNSPQAATTRGQQHASPDSSEPEGADEQGQSNQDSCHAKEELPQTKRNVRARGQKTVKSETVETTAVKDEDEAKHKRMGRKREMVQNTKDDVSSTSKICRGKEKETTEAAEEKGEDETKDESPVKAKRRGRASSARAKKNTKESPPEVEVKEESENIELEPVKKRGAAQKNKKETQEADIGTTVSSVSQDANMATPQTRTPTSSVSRKRQIPVDSSPVAKTPRSSRSFSASPAASGQLQTANLAYKVLFTGVVDEAGERVLTRLGGSMAKGVADMNCLVTDKVRRTVKFLCAVAKGVPIVTTHWLEKCDKAGRFLPTEAFVVKDPEQEKKFTFSLQESLKAASNQPLFQGYEIHVTKSVKPEPAQMKDIISCSGASFLSKMPSSHKPQTLVISCEEDWQLCGPAVSASLPVVTAEFILTGILQQKVDFQAYTLSPPATNPQPAGGRGRGRKKT